MTRRFHRIYHDICIWAKDHGIEVQDDHLPVGQAGEFDGPTATMNSDYDLEERTYYLTHAIGSVVRWSLANDRSLPWVRGRIIRVCRLVICRIGPPERNHLIYKFHAGGSGVDDRIPPSRQIAGLEQVFFRLE
jgi:hypothetical protein